MRHDSAPEAARAEASFRPGENPEQARPQAPAANAPQAAEQARVKRLSDLPRDRWGLPFAGPAEADWSADIFTPTTTQLSRGR